MSARAKHAFVHQSVPAPRVVFGPGALATLADEVARLGAERVLVLCTPGQAALGKLAVEQLGSRVIGCHAHARPHVPLGTVTEALGAIGLTRADLLLPIGGSSTIGLAKAIALATTLSIVAVPTTYAGSEATPIWGVTDAAGKRTGRDLRVLPRLIVYDPELTQSLPIGLSVTSGLNAIAHAIEALYAPDGNPLISALAEDGLRGMAEALPHIASAREEALQAAWLCGTVLGRTTMGLHHKLCHVLGGSFDLPHAETHAVLIPHVVRHNASHAPDAMKRIARALDVSNGPDAVDRLAALAKRVGAPPSLAAIGMSEESLEQAADLAVASPYANPRLIDRSSVLELLQRAFQGV